MTHFVDSCWWRGRALLVAALAVAACDHTAPKAASGAPSAAAGSTPPDATPASAPGLPIRRLRRLSSREYDNVVRDLLGDTTSPARQFVEDAYQNGYDNGSAGLAVQADQVTDYQAAAEALAESAVRRNFDPVLGGCRGADAASCADGFLDGFARRAFRRPLTATERQRLRDVFEAAVVGSPGLDGRPGDRARGPDFSEGVRAMLEVVLQSPPFLYREELGSDDSTDDTTHLTSYELASELSFLITGSLPDDELWDAAEHGRLDTEDDLRREAARLLVTPSAKDAFRSFMHRWLTTYRLPKLSKDATTYPTFDAAMAASMAGELDRDFDALLTEGRGSLHELFTSSRSFVDPTLAALYGAQTTGRGFQPITLDPATRKGVLSRAGFLAVHAAADSSGPIARGVFVLDAILCSPMPPPPANIPTAVAANDPSVQTSTTRQRFEAHVNNPSCAGCHRRIDGVGFGFEQFDGIGAFRTTENGQPIDASGTLIGTGDGDGPFTGLTELTTRVADGARLRDCYVKQAYRYAMGQIEPGGDDLRWLGDAFTSDARITDIFLTLVVSRAFAVRAFESPTP